MPSVTLRRGCALFLVLLSVSCGDDPAGPSGPVSIRIGERQPLFDARGDSLALTVVVKDRDGNTLTDQPVTWSTSAPSVVSVSPRGIVHAEANGTAVITARLGTISDTTTVTVARRPARLVFLTRPESQLSGRPLEPAIRVAVEDARGNRLTSSTAPITLSLASSAGLQGTTTVTPIEGVATFPDLVVSEPGLGHRLEAQMEGVASERSAFFNVHIGFAEISAGGVHSCGMTVDGIAYCWGENAIGRVGDGTTTVRATPVRVAGTQRFASINAGSPFSVALTVAGLPYWWGSGSTVVTSPTPVVGGPAFSSLDVRWHACGLTAARLAYCWGAATYAYGAGSSDGGPERWDEVRLAMGGRAFSAIATGIGTTCGIATDGTTWCAGEGIYGQLGNGASSLSSTPVRVAGDLHFTAIAAGNQFACGIATDGATYCWGRNERKQLGDPAVGAQSNLPVEVVGKHRFTRISLGASHACGVTGDDMAYCWGSGSAGLGSGEFESDRAVPVAVAGNHRFRTISAGSFHTCGIARDGFSYCWGDNLNGALGTGGGGFRTAPTLIAPPAM